MRYNPHAPIADARCLTEVFGEAAATCEPEFVRIRVSVKNVAKTTDAARSGARKTMDEIYAQIRQLQQQGVRLPEDGLHSSFSISPVYRHRHDMQLHVGYSAEFDLLVQSPDTDRAAQIFEVLAQVTGAALDSPTFHLGEKKRQALRDEAFLRAVSAAKARFGFQCRAIGFDPDDCRITAWRYQRSDFSWGSGKMVSVGGSDVTIGGDKAEVKATVYLTYNAQ